MAAKTGLAKESFILVLKNPDEQLHAPHRTLQSYQLEFNALIEVVRMVCLQFHLLSSLYSFYCINFNSENGWSVRNIFESIKLLFVNKLFLVREKLGAEQEMKETSTKFIHSLIEHKFKSYSIAILFLTHNPNTILQDERC
jgi:hypothetical protein